MLLLQVCCYYYHFYYCYCYDYYKIATRSGMLNYFIGLGVEIALWLQGKYCLGCLSRGSNRGAIDNQID